MIRHISIDVRDPLRATGVLAEILDGKVYKFFVPGSYIAMPFDNYGTHIVVFEAGDAWTPGADVESAKVIRTAPANFVSSHAAISVPTPPQQIEKIGQREGWRVLIRKQGGSVPFSATEFWVENRWLFEFLSPEFESQHLQTMQPERIEQMLDQPIVSVPG
jgi:hypothetical protein